MAVNGSLDKLEKMISGAWRIPLTKGKSAISTEKLQNLIDDIRLELPGEIKDAKIVMETRKSILENARQEAKNIVRTAKTRAQYLISETNIVKQSKQTAINIMVEAKQRTNQMHQQTNAYVEELIDNLEKVINETAKNFKISAAEIRQIIKKK